MAEAKFDEAAIRREAYYLWEADGRPHGHDHHYWSRAVDVLTARQAKPAKPVAKKSAPKAKAEPEKLKAAASKVKTAPSKSTKPEPTKKPSKPKKK